MFGLFIDPSDAQIERISLGIKRSLETPIVGDIQGFIWEKIFAYGHDILDMLPSKKLFDVVTADGRGWFCKTIESNAHEIGCRVEYAIARSDIYSKGIELGFRGGLTKNSPPQVLGEALIKHFNQKFQEDRSGQNVHAPTLRFLSNQPTGRDLHMLRQLIRNGTLPV